MEKERYGSLQQALLWGGYIFILCIEVIKRRGNICKSNHVSKFNKQDLYLEFYTDINLTFYLFLNLSIQCINCCVGESVCVQPVKQELV